MYRALTVGVAVLCVAGTGLAAAAAPSAHAGTVPQVLRAGSYNGIPGDFAWARPTYRVGDFGGGLVRSILPTGENGLVNAAELAQFEATGKRPPGSQDQLAPYANLLYAALRLTDAQLPSYYNDESFGVRPGDITATVRPNAKVPVVIYYDKHHVPHIYGATDQVSATTSARGRARSATSTPRTCAS